MTEKIVFLKEQSDVVSARQAGRETAKELGFGSADQTRFATAISELARNVIQYAGEGVCRITVEKTDEQAKVKVEVEDNGPGIPDVEKAMEYGFTTGKSLGVGLPGTRKLVHEFRIETEPGHTKITIAMVLEVF